MDENSAKELLTAVREQQEKSADWESVKKNLSAYVPSFQGGTAQQQQQLATLKEMAPKQLALNRQRNVVNAMLLALGGGAALRGGLGLSRMFSDTKPVPSRTVDMEMPYADEDEEKEAAGRCWEGYEPVPGKKPYSDDSCQPAGSKKKKKAEKAAADTVLDSLYDAVGMGPAADPQHTTESGVAGYLPSLLLGTPLAAYAGWKGVDALFDRQRKQKTQDKLEKAKERYEQALVGSYDKEASDRSDPAAALDAAFDMLEKTAEGSMFNPMNWFPNLSGQAKGLLATYALLSGPAAYMYVNDRMQKGSKKEILRKAMRERARRQAMQSPAELYAVPSRRPAEEQEQDEYPDGKREEEII